MRPIVYRRRRCAAGCGRELTRADGGSVVCRICLWLVKKTKKEVVRV